MKNKHKTLSSLLALSVLMGATPTMVFAEDFIEETGAQQAQNEKVAGVSNATELSNKLQSSESVEIVQLTNDITLDSKLDITLNKNITLDLNGHSITLPKEKNTAFMEVKSKDGNTFELTLKNSSNEGKIALGANATAILVAANAKMVTENINIEFTDNTGGANGVFKVEGELLVKAGTNIKSAEGGIWVQKDGKLTVKDGYIESKYYAVTGNGTNYSDIKEGTKITIDGGILIASGGSGIYHPQKGKLVLNAGTITGLTGVQMCAGELEIPEDSKVIIKATGSDDRTNKGTGDGPIDDGSAISVIDRTASGYVQKPTVKINGGSFASEKTDNTILAYGWTNSSGQGSVWSDAKNNTDVTGGEFNKGFDKDFIKNEAPFVQVDGTYHVAKDENALKEIVADAENSVVLLKNVSNVTVPGGVKVENKTGGNVTVNGTTVENGKDINIPTSNGGGATQKLSKVYRAYNPNNGEHLYTLDEKEYKHVTSIGWQAEDVAFMAEEEKNGQALYRVYNPNSGLHHYTLDENEKNTLVSLGWHDEKVAWYTSKKPQSAPVFRVYNPNDGNHHYTMNQQEKDVLVSLGWHDEGLAFRTAPIEK